MGPGHHQRLGAARTKRGESRRDLLLGRGFHYLDLQPDDTRGFRRFGRLRLDIGIVRIDEQHHQRGDRDELTQQVQPLGDEIGDEKIHTRGVAAGAVEGGGEPMLDRVIADEKDDGYR